MSNKKYKVINVQDWSKVDEIPISTEVASNINSVSPNQIGLYKDDKGQYHTSGFVGIKKLYNKDGSTTRITDSIDNDYGKEVVLSVSPRFNLNQWEMLSTVMRDNEFERYTHNDSNKFFEIFYNEKPIKINTSENGGELILAMSFVRCCQVLCRKQLKSKLEFTESNLNGKLRGNIVINKHIKQNLTQGRADRIYCRYPTFSIDTLENRILKAALSVADKIIKNNSNLNEMRKMIRYCKTSFQNVRSVSIKKSDFSSIKITGFNSYYKDSIDLAKILLNYGTIDISQNPEKSNYKMIIPYVIKMESLFEFYVRSKIKEYLNNNKFDNLKIDKYRTNRDKDVLKTIDNNSGAYLMESYIPDIALMRKCDIDQEWKYIAVYDVKYQNYIRPSSRDTVRHNSHQLLFYMLLLNVNKCGFIFPELKLDQKINRTEEAIIENTKIYTLNIQDGNASKQPQKEYTQWIIGNNQCEINFTFEKMIKYSMDIN